MSRYKVGDRVHNRLFRDGTANGRITRVMQMRTGNGIPCTGYEVEYEEPVRGPWPCNIRIRKAVHCAMALEAL